MAVCPIPSRRTWGGTINWATTASLNILSLDQILQHETKILIQFCLIQIFNLLFSVSNSHVKLTVNKCISELKFLVSHHWKICQRVGQGLANIWSRVIENLIPVNSSSISSSMEPFSAFKATELYLHSSIVPFN